MVQLKTIAEMDALPLEMLNLVIQQLPLLDLDNFGATNTYFYYYTKADLRRQTRVQRIQDVLNKQSVVCPTIFNCLWQRIICFLLLQKLPHYTRRVSLADTPFPNNLNIWLAAHYTSTSLRGALRESEIDSNSLDTKIKEVVSVNKQYCHRHNRIISTVNVSIFILLCQVFMMLPMICALGLIVIGPNYPFVVSRFTKFGLITVLIILVNLVQEGLMWLRCIIKVERLMFLIALLEVVIVLANCGPGAVLFLVAVAICFLEHQIGPSNLYVSLIILFYSFILSCLFAETVTLDMGDNMPDTIFSDIQIIAPILFHSPKNPLTINTCFIILAVSLPLSQIIKQNIGADVLLEILPFRFKYLVYYINPYLFWIEEVRRRYVDKRNCKTTLSEMEVMCMK